MKSMKIRMFTCRAVAVVAASLCLVVAGATHEWNPNGSGGWGDSTRWKGGGTLSGFAFAADTSVRLVNCDASALGGGRVMFPLDLSGCTGLDDTSRWTLSINGSSASNLRLRVSGEGIAIVPAGLYISFR